MIKASVHSSTVTPTVAVRGLGKQFVAPAWAVRNISFSCMPGELLGLLGENGAGKTTTLRLLAASLLPTEGSVQVAGYDTRSQGSLVRRQVGFLLGGRSGLYERLTARENIRYFAELNGVGKRDFERRLKETSELLDMHDFLDRNTGEFSTGMMQKTCIARSIIHDPSLLLLDEPTSGLDVFSSHSIYQCIYRYRDLGKSVIFSSHNIESAARICDRFLIIHKGAVLMNGTPKELMDQYGTSSGSYEQAFMNLIKKSDSTEVIQ